MIVAQLQNENGTPGLLFVLEPGNIAKLELGQPIVKHLKEFLPNIEQDIEIAIGYSPDVDYIAEQVQGGSTFESALARSLQRRPQYRSHESSEQLKKVEGEVR